jgi:hypothetical protein
LADFNFDGQQNLDTEIYMVHAHANIDQTAKFAKTLKPANNQLI